MKKSPKKNGVPRNHKSGSRDLVHQYLKDIGKVELLNYEEEIILARLVQRREVLLAQQVDLSSNHLAIRKLIQLEKLQQREANRFCHWPTNQELADASGINLIEIQKIIQDGYKIHDRILRATKVIVYEG